MSIRYPYKNGVPRPPETALLQCIDCNTEFWSTDRWDLRCLKCEPDRPVRVRPSVPRRPLTHREFVKAGADREARDKQPHAPWRRSPGERESYD